MLNQHKKVIFGIVIGVILTTFLMYYSYKNNPDLIEEMKNEYYKEGKIGWVDFNVNEKAHELSKEEIHKADKIIDGYGFNSTEGEIRACLLAVVLEDENSEDGGEEVKKLRYTIREIEDRFNSKYNYPYVILSPKPLSDRLIESLAYLTHAKIRVGVIPHKHWSIPDHINRHKARESRKNNKIIHANSLYFRHFNRYWTGFIFRHDLTKNYDYYLRIDAGAQFPCDINDDPFQVLHKSHQLYGFTQSVHEIEDTIPTLWSTSRHFFKQDENYVEPKSIEWISSDNGESYNLCHFWNSFEIASFSVWRNSYFLKYFEKLDQHGGFFYERWAEGPIKTLFLTMKIGIERIRFFDEIGFYKEPFSYCPDKQASGSPESKVGPVCSCDPKSSTDKDGLMSCNPNWLNITLRI